MKKGRDIIGMPVLNSKDGVRLGSISAVLYSVNGPIWLIVETLEGKEMAMSLDQAEMHDDSMVLTDTSQLQSLKAISTNSLHRLPDDRPLPVVLEGGRHIGRISDILLDMREKRMKAVELSMSLVDDIIQGRNVLMLTGHEISDSEGMKIPEWEYNNICEGGRGLRKFLGLKDDKIRKE